VSPVQASKAFCNLHRRLRTLIEQENQAGKVRALPLSAIQVARVAEGLPEFGSLIYDLFEVGSPEDLDVAEWDLEAAQVEWEVRYDHFSGELAELLKRSGYYHGLMFGSDDVDRFYSAIKERIPAKNRTVTRLYLLDGCKFSHQRFEVSGIQVVQMSPTELEELGPSSAVCRDFLPSESMDSDRFSQQWFLKVQENLWTAYDYELWDDLVAEREMKEDLAAKVEGTQLAFEVLPISAGPKEISVAHLPKSRRREIAAGYMAEARTKPPTFPSYLDAILLLSLYRRGFFEITKILLCEPGWRRMGSVRDGNSTATN
jgi:hypothetical protein